MSSKFYNSNMETLRKTSPHLAARVDRTVVDNTKYEVISSKTDVPTVKIVMENNTAKFLHSYYDPLKEACRIIEKTDLSESPNFVSLGFGFGYHIDQLIKKAEGSVQIFIIERDIELFKLALINRDLTKMLQFSGLNLFVGQSFEEIRCNLSLFQSGFLVYGIKELSVTAHHAGYYQEILTIIKDMMRNAEVNLATYLKNIKRFYKNMFENIAEILFSYGVYNLKDKYRDFPAILISAGPSIEKNIHLLKKVRKKAVFIAVATALKPLLKNGISPDFVVALDYNPVSEKAFQEIENVENVSLLFDPKIPHSILQRFNGCKFVYQGQHSLLNWFSRMSEDKGIMGRPLTVSHLAFFLARLMGCSPIIFTGQDLNFTDDSTHAKNTFYMDEYLEEVSQFITLDMVKKKKLSSENNGNWRKTKDIYGKDIDILQNMYTYLQFFENEIVLTKSKCIDATEGGAAIQGSEIMTLKEALCRFCNSTLTKEPLDKSCRLYLNLEDKDIIEDLIFKKNEFRSLEKYCLNIKKVFNNGNKKSNKFFQKAGRLKDLIDFQRENKEILDELNEKEVLSRIKTDYQLLSNRYKDKDKDKTREIEFERDLRHIESVCEGSRFLQRLIDIAVDQVKSYRGLKDISKPVLLKTGM